MQELKALSVEELETLLGHRISYAGISPSFLSYLEVRDLVIHDTPDSTRPLLTIHRVRIYYSLVHLLARRDPVGAVREIRILNTRFSLDVRKDQNVLELLQRLTQAGSGASGLRARITGANVGVSLQTSDGSFTLSDLFFQIDASSEALAVSLRGDCQGELTSGFAFSSTLGVEGKIDRRFTWSDLTMRLLEFDSSVLRVGKQTLQVVWKGDRIQVHKIQDHSPIDLGMTADLSRQEINVDFQADGLRPDRLFQFSGSFERFNTWLSAPLTASGKLTYSLKDHHVAYSGGVSAAFADQLPVHDVILESTFLGDERGASFFPLRVSSSVGTLQFDGKISFSDMFPEGLLTLVNVDAGSGHRVTANLTIERQDGKLSVQGRHLLIGEVGFDAFALSLSPQEKGTSFTFSSSFADAPASRVTASGELRLGQTLRNAIAGSRHRADTPPTVSLSASLQNAPPDRVYHLVLGAGPLTREQEDVRSRLSRYVLSASFDVTTDLSSVAVSNGNISIAQADDPTTAVRFSLDMDASRLTVSGLSGSWRGYPIEGSVNASIGEGAQVSFSSDFKLRGTPFSLAGRYSDRLGLYATGAYGVEISVVPNRDGTYSLEARGRRLPVPMPGSTVALSFDLSGLFSSLDEWVIRAPSFIVYDAPFLESKRNTIELAGRLTPKRLSIDHVKFTDSYSTLEGSAEASLSLPSDPFKPDFLSEASARFTASLASPNGPETYGMKGTLGKGEVSADIAFKRVPLGRLRAFSFRGSLSGSGTVAGPLEKPVLTLAMNLDDGRLGNDPLAANGQVSLVPGQVRIASLKVDYLAHHISGASGTIDIAKGAYDVQTTYVGEYFLDHVQLTARLQGQFNPEAPGGTAAGLLSHGLQGTLSLGGITVEGRPYSPWAISFRGERGRLTFDGGPGNSVHGSIDSNLAFALHMSRPLPLVGDAGGRIVGDRIVANATIVTADMLVLNSILKSPQIPTASGSGSVLTFTSGTASGRLSFTGPFGDPDFTGELAVVGGRLRSAYAVDEVGPINTKLVFDGKGFHSPRVLVNAGASRLGAQLAITIDHWQPQAFDLAFSTENETTAHLKVRFGRLIADGRVQGSITIKGDDSKTNVTGAIQVTDCRITLGQYEVPKFVPEDVPTFLALDAETGKRVDFAWPSENYPVIRTTASPGGRVAITYRGDTGAYTVKGATNVQGGEIYYFERSFVLKKGAIAFNEDQQNFDPRITARAELREWDPSSAEEMKIFLDADSPLSKFTPRFSSDPPRSDTYIMAMIGAPFVARAETQGLGISAALMSSDVISQTWILRPLEQRLRDVLRLDMVSVRTQIIQNLLVQRVFGTTLNPLDNTSVSLGKYIGNDLFLELLVRLQSPQLATGTPLTTGAGALPYEDVRTGATVPPGSLTLFGNGLQPDLELSMEWATPLFLLTWSWAPQHPENLFLSDHSLAFSWRIAY